VTSAPAAGRPRLEALALGDGAQRNVVRVAVVGHVEWVGFARVARLPARGEIIHAREHFELAAGGGAVAAVQLARLAGSAELFCALGDDEAGVRSEAELAGRGVRVHGAVRARPQRRGFTYLDDGGERTITILSERLVPTAEDPLPWSELERADAVYFTAGDAGALRYARRSRVLVATPRASGALLDAGAGLTLDALVSSRGDADEHRDAARLAGRAALTVQTEGGHGGRWRTRDGRWHRFAPAPLPGPMVDAYGCGDSFAAGLTLALGEGLDPPAALALAARCGAVCLTGTGPYGAQLAAADR